MWEAWPVSPFRLTVAVPSATAWQVVSPDGAVRLCHHAPPVYLPMVSVAASSVTPLADRVGVATAATLNRKTSPYSLQLLDR